MKINQESPVTARAAFTRMDESTEKDWSLIVPEFKKLAAALPDRVLTHLQLLSGEYGGFPVDRFSHSLQTATLDMPILILPSVQVNIRAGEMPPAEDNGVSYLKIPLNAL